MEEYKDTELTLDVFTTVLDLPQFRNYQAGIVVQAYLPDAWQFQSKLLEFAKKRVAEGGAPIKMRLVKGANLQMETIISSLKGWEIPTYSTKTEVDANYLRLLDRALEPKMPRWCTLVWLPTTFLHLVTLTCSAKKIRWMSLLLSKCWKEWQIIFLA